MIEIILVGKVKEVEILIANLGCIVGKYDEGGGDASS